MRSDDMQDPSHTELGHVYERINTVERKLNELQDGQHRMEVALAGKPRFPVWLPTVMSAVLLFLAGQTLTAIWWASQITAEVSSFPALEQRLTSAFQAMRNSDATVAAMQAEHVRMRTELDGINKRTIEGTDDRWRKRDDVERMAQNERWVTDLFSSLVARLEKEERRSEERDRLWQQVLQDPALLRLAPSAPMPRKK